MVPARPVIVELGKVRIGLKYTKGIKLIFLGPLTVSWIKHSFRAQNILIWKQEN